MAQKKQQPVEHVDVVLLDENTVWPQDYDWQKYFARVVNGVDGLVTVEATKLRGVVLQLVELKQHVAALAAERTRLLKTVAALAHENAELQKQMPKEPRKIQTGDRVQATMNAGFHKGAKGTVRFVEPSYEKVWVLRDGASSPVFYHPDELVILDEQDVVTASE